MSTDSIDPIIYTEQINAQNKIFSEAFKTFMDSYTTYITDYSEDNETEFFNAADYLKVVSNNIYNIALAIQTSANNLQEYNQFVKLTEIKDKNEKLTNSFVQTENQKNGSKAMIHNVKSEYNHQYYKNIQLFIGIIATIFLSTKIFSSK